MTKINDLIALRDAVEAGGWTVTNWRDFSALPAGDADNPNAILAHRAYHGHLDAALALHEALLPKWAWQVGVNDEKPGEFEAIIWRASEVAEWRSHHASAGLHARAWLLAILEALIAQEAAE